MKNRLFIAICTALVMASCTTPRNFNYLQDLQNGQQMDITIDGTIRLQPNDQLTVVVKSKDPLMGNLFNKTLTTQITQGSVMGNSYISPYTVSKQGTIDFPVIGEIHVGGMTRQEVETTIKQELQKEQLKDANVTVELQNLTYTVAGEVNAPGVYKIEKDKLTLFEALGQAHDLGVYGKSGKDLFNSEAYYVHQNDIIYVKPNDVKARQSTANGNETRSISFWMSIVSVLTTVAILVFK